MKSAEATRVLEAARDLAPVISARAADIESGRRLPVGCSPTASATLAWVAETTASVVETCYRAGGASSLKDGSPLQRRFRDIHTFRQHAAAAEGWFGQAGAALLGQPTGFWT